jgi:hypothetical protein
MEHGRQRVLRSAKPIEHVRNALKAEAVAGRREHRQAIQLRLDARMHRARKIGHYAAAFASGAR